MKVIFINDKSWIVEVNEKGAATKVICQLTYNIYNTGKKL